MSEIKFELDDRVWSFRSRDWGSVVELDDRDQPGTFKIKVQFAKYGAWCEADDLFFEEIIIPESARTRPKPKHEFKPGDPVCVRGFDFQFGKWYPRAFESKRADGKFICRASSCPNEIGVWAECVPYDRTLLGFDAEEK